MVVVIVNVLDNGLFKLLSCFARHTLRNAFCFQHLLVSFHLVLPALIRVQDTNYNDLPLILSVPDVASVLGISRAGAYELVRSDGFPSLRIGSRIVVPKEKLIAWINANTRA